MAGLLAGCGGSNGDDRTLEETVEQSYEVDANATLTVSNTDGSIRVYAADVTEISVKALKRAFTAERLRKIDINTVARRDAVEITTSYPPTKKWGLGDRSGTVDYTIVVPFACRVSKLELTTGELVIDGLRGGEARAHLGSGRLFAHNCFSNISVTTDEGVIDVYYDWWEERRKFSIDAAILDGSVRAFIPIESSFHLVAESESGHVANDFSEKEQRQAGGVRKIDKVIGTNAGVEVRLHAKDGNVKMGEITY